MSESGSAKRNSTPSPTSPPLRPTGDGFVNKYDRYNASARGRARYARREASARRRRYRLIYNRTALPSLRADRWFATQDQVIVAIALAPKGP